MMKRNEALTILGLTGNPTEKEITTAYRAQALKSHPDKGGSKEAFQALGMAKELLESLGKSTAASQEPEAPTQSSKFNSSWSNPFKKTDAEILEQIKREDAERQQRAESAAKKNAAACKSRLHNIHNILYRSLSVHDFDTIWLKSEAPINRFINNHHSLKAYPRFVDGSDTIQEIRANILRAFFNMVDPTTRENRNIEITINQNLIDTLLDKHTDLEELFEVFLFLSSYRQLNISSMDLILNHQTYRTIVNTLIEKFYQLDLNEKSMTQNMGKVLDFFFHFKADEIESILFEDEIKKSTADTIMTIMEKYSVILDKRKKEHEEAAEQAAEKVEQASSKQETYTKTAQKSLEHEKKVLLTPMPVPAQDTLPKPKSIEETLPFIQLSKILAPMNAGIAGLSNRVTFFNIDFMEVGINKKALLNAAMSNLKTKNTQDTINEFIHVLTKPRSTFFNNNRQGETASFNQFMIVINKEEDPKQKAMLLAAVDNALSQKTIKHDVNKAVIQVKAALAQHSPSAPRKKTP